MRSFLVGSLSLCLLVSLAPAGGAAPSTGDLAFDTAPRLAGALSAVGGGEVPLDGNQPANLAGTGTGITLTRVWREETVLSAAGTDHRIDTPVDPGDDRREDIAVGAGAFSLGATGDTFRGLVFATDEGRLEARADHVESLTLDAFASPQLIVDDYGLARPEEGGAFTYQADGDRFPLVVDTVVARAGFTVFLFDAELVVNNGDGDQTRYTSGTSREAQPGGVTRIVHEHHLLHVPEGSATIGGEALITWLADPTLTIDGRLDAEAASGSVRLDGTAHTFDDVPVTLMGHFDLRPIALGEPTPAGEDDGVHVSTRADSERRYPGARGFVDGDVSALAIGGRQLVTDNGDLAVAAAAGIVGVAGLALLFAPGTKWALAGVFAPLYAKTQRDRLLDNESRDRIFQAIRNNPGINLSQIHRVVDLGWGVTVYHLKMMEKNHLIVSETSARDRCFFENDPRFIELRKAIATIANREPVQRIVRTIVATPGLNQGEVIAATGLTQRTVSYYLGRLSKSALVETTRVKNFVHYEPSDALRRALDALEGPQGDETSASAAPVAVPA